MAEFSVNVMRQDPYKATRFSVKWDGKEIPGIRSISALDWAAEVVRFRSGLSPNQVLLAPGTVTFAPLVLTRGRTRDGIRGLGGLRLERRRGCDAQPNAQRLDHHAHERSRPARDGIQGVSSLAIQLSTPRSARFTEYLYCARIDHASIRRI